MEKHLVPAVVTAVLLAIGTAAFAQQASESGWFHERAARMIVATVERDLSLTDAQREKVRNLLTAEKPRLDELSARRQVQSQRLAALTTFDEATIRQIAQQQQETAADILVEREKLRFALLAILTPEQRTRLASLRRVRAHSFDERLTRWIALI
ncbi:MAG: Spy/CpxP family protein refolding chaperone [Acidobacteriaceae bacterium]|nr:Spy/CpxP family protein refolding chaperone [Acidobacteriaceae bacterium]